MDNNNNLTVQLAVSALRGKSHVLQTTEEHDTIVLHNVVLKLQTKTKNTPPPPPPKNKQNLKFVYVKRGVCRVTKGKWKEQLKFLI